MHDLQALVRRYALGVWRWRWLVAGLSWVICLAGWAFVTRLPNVYEANARLYVEADAVLTPLLRGVALDSSPAAQVDMLTRTLLSRPNLEKVISKTDLELQITGPTALEGMVQMLARSIKISQQTSNLFTITYRNTRPKLAYDVVQNVLALFIESKAGNNRADMENARRFLEQQISRYEQKLRQMEAQRAAFDAKYVGLLPDANGGASALDATRSAVLSLQEALKQARLRENLAKQQLATTPATIPAGTDPLTGASIPGAASGEPRACQDLDAARVRFTDQNPTVVMLKAECDDARKREAGTVRRGGVTSSGRMISNPIAEKLKLQIFDLESAIASIQQQILDKTAQRDRLETMARNAPGIQAQYTDLLRDYGVVRKNYEELIQRREEMRIAAAADTEAEKVKLQVVDPPQVPNIPVAPNRLLLITVVLPMGLGVGIGGALLLQQFDTSFHTVEELRGLGRPVMGAVSLVAIRPPLVRRLIPVLGFASVLLALCAVYGGLVLHIMRKGALGA